MSTVFHDYSHASVLFGKTRWAVLAVLFGSANEAFYLRQLARVAGVGLGAVQREVKRLTLAGILRRTTQGRHVYYQANCQSPIFGELKDLVTKSGGEFLGSPLVPLAERIRVGLVCAWMEEDVESDVAILTVGDGAAGEPADASLRTEEMVTFGQFSTKLASWIDDREHVPAEYFLETIVSQPDVNPVEDEEESDRFAEGIS